ncbi:hypothetical protein L202_00651 [Cryptococcus amylolentus CBS 6039]|uniref:Chromo domain-containing protein n=1 Tax=Cryptococcus amylolentus CBS 6039 TaxID=1295533 RepID=A0A1E3I8F7_9TREE|nr:hypothetical protein L202_00651 [Cryptococcus amylolentus CBS 6039]ODN84778.1 hypothetical protein L202_00651 [Cryptococcus amylolentus CBS 6039]
MDPFDYFAPSTSFPGSPFAANYPRPVVNTKVKSRPLGDIPGPSRPWPLPVTSRPPMVGSAPGSSSSSSLPFVPYSHASMPQSHTSPNSGTPLSEASQEVPSVPKQKLRTASKPLSSASKPVNTATASKEPHKRRVAIASPTSAVLEETPQKRQRTTKTKRNRPAEELAAVDGTSVVTVGRLSGNAESSQDDASTSPSTANNISGSVASPRRLEKPPAPPNPSQSTPISQSSDHYNLGIMGSNMLGRILPSRLNQPSPVHDLQKSIADVETSFQSQFSALDDQWQSRLGKLESEWAGKLALAQLEVEREMVKAREAAGEMKEKLGRLEGAVAVLMRQSQEQQRHSQEQQRHYQELQRQHESQLSGVTAMIRSVGMNAAWTMRVDEQSAMVGNLEQTLSVDWTREDAMLDLAGLPVEPARDEEKEVVVHSMAAGLIQMDQGQPSASFLKHSTEPTHVPAISPREIDPNQPPYAPNLSQPMTGAHLSTFGRYSHDGLEQIDDSDQDGEYEVEPAESLFEESPPPRPPPRKPFPPRSPNHKAAPHAMSSLDSLFDESPGKHNRPQSKVKTKTSPVKKPKEKDRVRGTWDNPRDMSSVSRVALRTDFEPVGTITTLNTTPSDTYLRGSHESRSFFSGEEFDESDGLETYFDDASSYISAYSPSGKKKKTSKLSKASIRKKVKSKADVLSEPPELPPGVTLPASDGSRKSKGKWPNKKPFSIVGTMQEIVCDWCHGRCHWACAGLSEHVDMSERDWFCADCKHLQKVKGVTRKEYVDRSQEERCIRFNCILLDDIPEEAYQEEVFVVQRLIGRRTVRKSSAFSRANSSVETEWLVFWDGYELKDCSWEVRDNLAPHDKKLIADFDAVAGKEIGVEANEKSSLVLLEEAKTVWSTETGDAIEGM